MHSKVRSLSAAGFLAGVEVDDVASTVQTGKAFRASRCSCHLGSFVPRTWKKETGIEPPKFCASGSSIIFKYFIY